LRVAGRGLGGREWTRGKPGLQIEEEGTLAVRLGRRTQRSAREAIGLRDRAPVTPLTNAAVKPRP
jgi:hypothetical protein